MARTLGLVVSLLLLCGCAQNVVRATQTTPEPVRQVHLPIVDRGVMEMPEPAIGRVFVPVIDLVTVPAYYNCFGQLCGLNCLHLRWGDMRWTQGTAGTLTAIRACCGNCPASVTVHANRANVAVVFYWPDAPALDPALHNCGLTQGVVGLTNDNGDVVFDYGGGAYYYPPSAGPHVVWTAGGPCIWGLGMIGETNHEHVDLEIMVP